MIISSNLRTRLDGLPYSKQLTPTDKGIAVYFTHKKKQIVFACDKWDRIEHNVRAIEKTIEAIRSIERWGVSDMLDRTFTGFQALPQSTKRHWTELFEITSTATESEVKSAYLRFCKLYHPDKCGGNDVMFKEGQEAYQEYFRGN